MRLILFRLLKVLNVCMCVSYAEPKLLIIYHDILQHNRSEMYELDMFFFQFRMLFGAWYFDHCFTSRSSKSTKEAYI